MMADKEKDRYSLRVMTLFGLVVSVIIGIFALNIYYFKEVEKSLIEQTYQDLKRENDEALTYFRGMIRERFEVLEAFSAYGDLPEGSEIGVLGGQGITYYGIMNPRG